MRNFFVFVIIAIAVILVTDFKYGPTFYTPVTPNMNSVIKTLDEGKTFEQFPLAGELELDCSLIHARKTVNTLVIGSSRAETLTAAAMGMNSAEALNASKSMLTFSDLTTLWEAWKSTGRPLKRLVIFPDLLLYDGPVSKPSRCDLLAAKERGESTWFASAASDAKLYFEVFKQLLSIDSVEIAVRGARDPYDDILPDGAHLFPARERERDQVHVVRRAMAERDHFDKRPLTETYRFAFVAMLRDMRRHGVEETLLITPPYHPIVYEGNRKLLDAYDASIAAIAGQTEAKFYGASDGSKAGCTAEEYTDGRHPKTECMAKIWAQATGRQSPAEIRAPSGE